VDGFLSSDAVLSASLQFLRAHTEHAASTPTTTTPSISTPFNNHPIHDNTVNDNSLGTIGGSGSTSHCPNM